MAKKGGKGAAKPHTQYGGVDPMWAPKGATPKGKNVKGMSAHGDIKAASHAYRK